MRRSLSFSLLMLASAAVSAQTLQEAMQRALEVHPEVSAGVNSRLSADANLQAAKGGYLPSVDLLGGYGREGTDSPGSRTDEHGFKTLTRGESSVRLQQMIFDGFATSSEVGRQRATVNSRAYSLLGTAERTGLDVVNAYLNVLKRQELVRLAQENLRSQQGVGRMADLDQAEARLAQARNNLLTEEVNVNDAQVNYLSLVGNAPEGLSAPVGLVGELPESVEQARRQMIEDNPLLRSAEADVQATEQQYQAAKSAFYPRFDAELSRSADNNLDGDPGHNNDWQAMLRMRYNLFAGGSNKADLEAKSYQINEAMDIRNNALRVLNEDLGLAWNAWDNARAQLPIAEEYVDYSSKVRTSYQKQFTLGERSLLDLLDSENELFTAQRRLQEVKFIELFTQYRIKATMGTLLKSQGVVAPMAANALDEVKSQAQLPGLN